MTRILVLGGGLVGQAIARDLSADGGLEVVVADRDAGVRNALSAKYGILTIDLDITDAVALTGALQEADLVIGAVPGHVGYGLLETVIKAGRDVVDISFFPEDPFSLDDLAREKGVTAVVDAGLAPGLGNLVLGRYHRDYDRVDAFNCYVGGLPLEPTGPFKYQSVFSPSDVIEEYTRPARFRVAGRIVTRAALSGLEELDLPHVGRLEAFNTDGLRTLLHTMTIPHMVEKTLRYPGHAEQMRTLRDAGFFSQEPVEIGGRPVAPLDMTSHLLFQAWQPRGDGRDLVVMRVRIAGELEGRELITTLDLYDEYDRETGTTAMARTTGYTCAAAARLVSQGIYREPGIRPLEYVGAEPQPYDHMINNLLQRGITFEIHQEHSAAKKD